MNTGIYYLYEYQADQKIRNTGFLKLTKQEHTCFLQLNARNLPVSSGDTAKLSVFYLKENNINAGEFADIPCQTRRISEKTSISELHFPNQYPLKQIDGFFLVLPGGKILAAASPGLHFDTRKIVYLPPDTEEPAQLPKEDSPLPVSEPKDPDPIPETASEAVPQEVCEELPTPDTDVNTSVNIRKIRRSDLSCLPRRCWNLANNSFLLHGYHNYNHLLLIEEDGHYRLGVPGIYDSREARAAELFGFPEFTDSYCDQLSLSEDERNDRGRFGHWCRSLR